MDPSHHYLDPLDKIFSDLKSSKRGLSQEEANIRLGIFGKNVLEEEKKNLFLLFLSQFNNILVYVLIAACGFSALLNKWIDFFVIFFMIFINSVIGFFQELKAISSISELKKITQTQDRALRDGKWIDIPSSNVVPGDIISFSQGDVITADVRLLEEMSLMVDESSLTGESLPVIKDHSAMMKQSAQIFDLKNMLFASTHVVRGNATGVVINTGKNSEFAKIAKRAKQESVQSPLTKALSFFAKRYAFFLVALFLCIGLVGVFQNRSLWDLIYIFIAELVSAVPEGLPIVVTLVLVIGAVSLSRKKTYIRHLPAVETLGSATVVACDKTGTITRGKIEVGKTYFLDEEKSLLALALCNDAEISKEDPIDRALFTWVKNAEELSKKYPRIWSFPFDVHTKLMATMHTIDKKQMLFIKGAYESLKKMAINDKEQLKQFDEKLKQMSNEGLRVLACGYSLTEKKDPKEWKVIITGLIGFYDPAKPKTLETVRLAKKAGLRIIMLTGDYAITAKAIAKDVGIYDEGDPVLTGEDLEALTDGRLEEEIKRTNIFARILPEHKYKIVKMLQKNKEIVALTGDGINDVPALRAADLGIAMGDGSEAAINVSKMVIGDNCLSIIIDAIRRGRIIAENIRKVIYYLLSSSLIEISLITLAIFAGLPLPLAPLQILWINIVSIGVQDKFFAFAKEEEDVMKQPPRKTYSPFFDATQAWHICFFGIPLGIFAFFLFSSLLNKYSYELSLTIIFTSVVTVQWLNGIQAQKQKTPFFKNLKKSFFINPWIYLSLVIGLFLQLIVIYVVPHLFYAERMPLITWIYPIGLSLIGFLIIECRKWIEYFFKKTT